MSLQVVEASCCHYDWHLGDGEQLAQLLVEVWLIHKDYVNIFREQKLRVLRITCLFRRPEGRLWPRDRLLVITEAPQDGAVLECGVRLGTVEDVHLEVRGCPSDSGRNGLDGEIVLWPEVVQYVISDQQRVACDYGQFLRLRGFGLFASLLPGSAWPGCLPL